MLRINQQRSSSGAKAYFDEQLAQGDYYAKDAIDGRWFGWAAERLGLDDSINREAFTRLCDNLHPKTAEQLTARMSENRTVGYDFNFHCPKSLSILFGLTRDERLLEAFQTSVRETMQELEADAATRVRRGGQNAERTTGNLLWGEFVHLTSRPVNGVPDPHLHAHCFVFNATFDNVEEKWKAAQFRNIVRDAPYYEAAFHARLSKRMTQLGLAVERTKQGWEIEGLDRKTMQKFSRRTAQIEELAREQGITDAVEKAELGAKTRERKGPQQSLEDLRTEWKARLTPEEKVTIKSVLTETQSRLTPSISNQSAVNYALDHSFERQAVQSERRVLATALKRGYGSVSVEAVRHELQSRHEVIRKRDAANSQTLVTTREVLAEEAAVLRKRPVK